MPIISHLEFKLQYMVFDVNISLSVELCLRFVLGIPVRTRGELLLILGIEPNLIAYWHAEFYT